MSQQDIFPFWVPAPNENDGNPVISIETFIHWVEKEVEQPPGCNTGNTKHTITQLRKVFYDSETWNRFLIPETCEVPNLEKDVQKKLKRAQELKLKDGGYLDIGHVFAGLDAKNHPAEARLIDIRKLIHYIRRIIGAFLETYDRRKKLVLFRFIPFIDRVPKFYKKFPTDIQENIAAATWVGDLGEVLAVKIRLDRRQRGNTPEQHMKEAIKEAAPGQDMLGNIDAYIIGRNYDIDKESSGWAVSRILSDYYCSENSDQKHRYSIFAEEVDLKWKDKDFINKDKWIEDHIGQVKTAAIFCIGKSGNKEGIVSQLRAVLQALSDKDASWLLQLFLDELKNRICQEPPTV
jgi:hypothetical protein